MQATTSNAVSQGPIPVPNLDEPSQNRMETVQQQVADTEQDRNDEICEGMMAVEGEEDGISVNVESSEKIQPSTSDEAVKQMPQPVGPEAMMTEGEVGGVVFVAAPDNEQSLEHSKKPVGPVCIIYNMSNSKVPFPCLCSPFCSHYYRIVLQH